MKILTARPASMDFETYKSHMREQKKWIKERLRGFLVYKSSEIITIGKVQTMRKYAPFVGCASSLKPL